uniref:Uncharacterized protein n=1 Tax=Anopheles epiroticus TaxID=199890 RepID=A0A182PIA9_9DIPT
MIVHRSGDGGGGEAELHAESLARLIKTLRILPAGSQFGRSARTISNSSGVWRLTLNVFRVSVQLDGAVLCEPISTYLLLNEPVKMRLNWILLPLLALLSEAREERAYRGGKAEYMKADRKGETQFQHQKTIDGAVLGCFGYVDGQGKMFVTHYLADGAGYRSVSLSAPDKMTRDRLKLLRNGEDGPAAELFPVDCTEEGDLGRLKKMAEKIKQDFESEDPEEKQDDVSSETPEDEAADDSNDPKQSPKSGKEPSKQQPKKESGKISSKNKKPKEGVKSLENAQDSKDEVEPKMKETEPVSRFAPKGNNEAASAPGPATRSETPESTLADVFPTPPFEADPEPTRVGVPSDSNDVVAAISRVLPVIRDIGPPAVSASAPKKDSSVAPKTSAPSSVNGDVYDEVDDEEDTDTVDAVAPEKQQQADPEKPGQSTSQPTDAGGSCIEIILKVPTDARHVIVRTENPTFKTQDGASLNELVSKIGPGVYDVQLSKFDKVVFEKYDKSSEEQSQAPNNLGKAFNYEELVPKPKNSGPSQQAPGDSANAYLPKADSVRSR